MLKNQLNSNSCGSTGGGKEGKNFFFFFVNQLLNTQVRIFDHGRTSLPEKRESLPLPGGLFALKTTQQWQLGILLFLSLKILSTLDTHMA